MVVLYVFVSFIILLFVFLYIITLFLNWNNFVISGIEESEFSTNDNDYYIIIDKEFCNETNRKGINITVYSFILFCFQNNNVCRDKIISLIFKQYD